MITKDFVMNKIVNTKTELNETVTEVLNRQFIKITLDATLGHVSRILEVERFVAVVQSPIECNLNQYGFQLIFKTM